MKPSRLPIFAAIAITIGGANTPAIDVAAQESGATASSKSLDEAAVLGPPTGSPLAGAELDARTRSLAERMRCPICQGSSIADSPSSSALTMVAQVRDLLSRGYSEQQVLDYFVRSYGEFVLLQPKAEGFNLVVWLLPVAGVVIGVVLIAMRLRQSRARRDGATADLKTGSSAGATTARRIDDDVDPELARYVERVRSEVGS